VLAFNQSRDVGKIGGDQTEAVATDRYLPVGQVYELFNQRGGLEECLPLVAGMHRLCQRELCVGNIRPGIIGAWQRLQRYLNTTNRICCQSLLCLSGVFQRFICLRLPVPPQHSSTQCCHRQQNRHEAQHCLSRPCLLGCTAAANISLLQCCRMWLPCQSLQNEALGFAQFVTTQQRASTTAGGWISVVAAFPGSFSPNPIRRPFLQARVFPYPLPICLDRANDCFDCRP